MAFSRFTLACVALLSLVLAAQSDPANPSLRGADVPQSVRDGKANVTKEGAFENRRLGEPSFRGYDDKGEGKCETVHGGDPKLSFHGQVSGDACKKRCDKDDGCFGFSYSNDQNCLLWLEEEIRGGGNSWGSAHCHMKPFLSGYADKGEGKCQTLQRKDPAYSFHSKVTRDACKQLCDDDCNCFGFSSSSNCLLWLDDAIMGGGNSWGGAHCYMKKVFEPSFEMTKTAFTAAGGDKTNLPKADILKKYTKRACIHDAKEFAMFMANIMQESDKLKTAEEYTDHFTDADYDWGQDRGNTKCDPEPCTGSTCASKCKVQYYGRGYLQTTRLENYEKARKQGHCDRDDNDKEVNIVKRPEEVAAHKSLAWCTAAFYWRESVHEDRCRKGGESCDLGNTIDAINGAKECKGSHNDQARSRYCYYAKFYKTYTGTEPWADTACISDLGKKYDEGTC